MFRWCHVSFSAANEGFMFFFPRQRMHYVVLWLSLLDVHTPDEWVQRVFSADHITSFPNQDADIVHTCNVTLPLLNLKYMKRWDSSGILNTIESRDLGYCTNAPIQNRQNNLPHILSTPHFSHLLLCAGTTSWSPCWHHH